ncbi:MAG TPA: M3 family oligoendopeptidase, partial [Hyphomicrobiaceae bacterium]|nr:M3 family oligoendopeptidase [Hyphomicrobiaceae bacterium]
MAPSRQSVSLSTGSLGESAAQPNAIAAGGSSAGGADLGAMPEWDLGDLYASPTDPRIAQDLADGARRARRLKDDYQGRIVALATDGARLAEPILEYERLADLLGRLGSYAGLLYAANTADPERAKFYGDLQDKLTTISTDLTFLELELNQIPEDTLANALKSPQLARLAPWLLDLRKEKPYQLDEKLERLFLEKSATGASAWGRLFNETVTSLKFEIEGEAAPLGLEPTLNFLMHPEEPRRAAAEALSKVFKDNVRLFTLITNTLAKDKEISDRWRGFKDVADSRHLSNRVEAPVVAALVDAVRASYPALSHRYYAMKARWLGMKRLSFWDRNAPLPNRPDQTISWPRAREIVLDAYRGFAPEMADIARPFFDRNWIDAPIRPGKSPGAFSASTVPSAHPYILMNYQGKARDVMTLAHELGHGVHQVLAAKQGPLLAPTPLTLAETASVFGEMLTFRALLAETRDPAARKAMIAQKVEDMINTVVRQIAFYVFERRVHEARREGELTAEKLGEIWLDVQKESLGPAIDLGPGYENYWVYIG